jgi:hypothetical protein
MLFSILDTIIPEEIDFGMPSAAGIDFESYMAKYGIGELVSLYIDLIEATAEAKLQMRFQDLDGDQRIAVVNATSTKDFRLFSGFVMHVFRAYYTHAEVLAKIGSGSVPPFPTGNVIVQDDWDLLEPVYERGAVYRDVKELSR